MKITYLAYEKQTDGSSALAVVTKERWLQIIKESRANPKSEYRYFESDVIVDGNELDVMVIEVSREEHKRINAEKKAAARSRQAARNFQILSLDAIKEVEERKLPDLTNLVAMPPFEEEIISRVQLDCLKSALAAWKPWALDMLDSFLEGNQRTSTTAIARKYGVSEQTVRTYKRQLAEFIKNFFA